MSAVERPRASYWRRHWRGELSLPVSYWVNCLLLFGGRADRPRLRGFRRSDQLAAAPGRDVRCALDCDLRDVRVADRRCLAFGRPPSAARRVALLAGAARVALVLAAFVSAANIVKVGIPQSIEYVKIALEIDYAEPMRLTITDGGRTLAIEGPITFGLNRKVEALLAENADVRTIELSSIGGRVQEARKLARLIEARGFDTRSPKGCFSACTIAFMAGKERWLSPKAALGFHRYYFPGASDREMSGARDG